MDKAPPLRADVPCETQSPPDLRTEMGDLPPMRKVNHDAPGAAKAREKAKDEAVRWLRRDIKRLDLPLKVSDELKGSP